MGGFKYFITFIDDFSCYGHVELIHEKSDSLEAFKAFKARKQISLKQLILIEVVSTMGDMMRLGAIL